MKRKYGKAKHTTCGKLWTGMGGNFHRNIHYN